MQTGAVLRNGTEIGLIQKGDDGLYRFGYHDTYLKSEGARPISITLPLQSGQFVSDELFSFFFNMLSEGNIMQMQCRSLKIDEDDHFTRLLKTAGQNTIGSVTVKELVNE